MFFIINSVVQEFCSSKLREMIVKMPSIYFGNDFNED